jgi:hypothetical protein
VVVYGCVTELHGTELKGTGLNCSEFRICFSSVLERGSLFC